MTDKDDDYTAYPPGDPRGHPHPDGPPKDSRYDLGGGPPNMYDDVPGGPPRPGEPRDPAELRKYREVYGDALEETVDKEGRFLARMYATAKVSGEDKEFAEMLMLALKLKPQKVIAAGRVFKGLALIYEAIEDNSTEAWRVARDGHWRGSAADVYGSYISKVNSHISTGTEVRSLQSVAHDTGALVEAFGEGLAKWRRDMRVSIEKLAEHDREQMRILLESGVDIIDNDLDAAARATLKLVLKVWRVIDEAGKNKKDLLAKVAKSMDIKIEGAKDPEVDELEMTLHSSFDGYLVPPGAQR